MLVGVPKEIKAQENRVGRETFHLERDATDIVNIVYKDVEGGAETVNVAAAIVRAGVPVQGHVGLTPQTAVNLGGFKVQGKDAKIGRAHV